MVKPEVSTIEIEKLKKRARGARKEKGITHSEALELVAKLGGFDNWHQVVHANEKFRFLSRAFKKGYVFVFDIKEGMDVDVSDLVLREDHLLWEPARSQLFKWFVSRYDEEEPDGPLSRTHSREEQDEAYEEFFGMDKLIFRIDPKFWELSLAQVLEMVEERSFWAPQFVFRKGKLIRAFSDSV